MQISIAMATYNGAKYLREQLDSFRSQTLLPDELVVSDDVSNDDTLSIVEEFARTAPFQVRIFRNDTNLGYTRNFERAIELCAGDLIFLSDQDDIWVSQKIEKIRKLAEARSRIMLFMNDAELARGDGSPVGLTKLGQILSLGLSECRFSTGCCMAFRRDFAQFALPVPTPVFAHDIWFSRLALLFHAKQVVPSVMQYLRRHGENTSDWIASSTMPVSQIDLVRAYKGKEFQPQASIRLKELDCLKACITRNDNDLLLQRLGFGEKVAEATLEIARERNAIESRLCILNKGRLRRPLPIVKSFLKGQYKYFSGWKSMAKDLLYP